MWNQSTPAMLSVSTLVLGVYVASRENTHLILFTVIVFLFIPHQLWDSHMYDLL